MLRSQPADDISTELSRPSPHGRYSTMYRALRGAKLLDLILRMRLVHASEHKAQCAAVRTQLRTGQEPPDSPLAWETPLRGLDCHRRLTWRSWMAVRLMMGRRNQSLSRRLPMGDTHWLRMPNTLKPSFGCPMPMADGCCSSCTTNCCSSTGPTPQEVLACCCGHEAYMSPSLDYPVPLVTGPVLPAP